MVWPMSAEPVDRGGLAAWARRLPLLMYAMLLLTFGLGMYIFGVLMGPPRILFGLNAHLLRLNEWIVCGIAACQW